jgi:hypothetical protein
VAPESPNINFTTLYCACTSQLSFTAEADSSNGPQDPLVSEQGSGRRRRPRQQPQGQLRHNL